MSKTNSLLKDLSLPYYKINLFFYTHMKQIIQYKFSDLLLDKLYECLDNINKSDYENIADLLCKFIKDTDKRANEKKLYIKKILCEQELDVQYEILRFAIKLVQYRKVLLYTAKEMSNKYITVLAKDVSANLLSISYDSFTLVTPYSIRVITVLLLEIFNNHCTHNIFITTETMPSQKAINELYNTLTDHGLEFTSIYQIIIDECVKQSGVSEAGADYETRIYDTLLKNGFSGCDIKLRQHDKQDQSVEYDHLITCDSYQIGISAKRTVRERFKQNNAFVKNLDIDLLILVTLGIDLTKNTVTKITDKGTYIFVADELYHLQDYFYNNKFIYPASMLSKKTILSIIDDISIQ